MITYDMIEKGYDQGIVKLVEDFFHYTVCSIGEFFFYFGGVVAEELTPQQMIEYIPKEDILDSIFEVLEDFRKDDTGYFEDEYAYYEAYLKENLK